MNAVHLCRVDPARNMSRFYRLDVQPDLFGGVLLMKEWGRIGARGRIMAERYDSAAPALAALQNRPSAKGGGVTPSFFLFRIMWPQSAAPC